MHTAWRYWLALGVLVVLNAAGWIWLRHSLSGPPGPTCQVLSTLPTGPVDETDRLTLVFDRPLVAADVCDQPLTRSPFVIEPDLPGDWSWTAPDRLELRLDAPPPPGRRLVARPAPDFEQQIGRALVGRRELVFETRALALESAHITHGDESRLELHLEFNQPVLPQDLIAQARLSCFGVEELALTASRADARDEVVLEFHRPAGLEVTLTLDATLAGHEADRPLGKTTARKLRVPDRFAFIDVRAETPGLDSDTALHLRFTEPLDVAATLPPIEIKPSIGAFSTQRSGRDLILRGPFEPASTYQIIVPSTLLSARGATLREAAHRKVTLEARSPRVAFAEHRGILTPHGHRLLDLRTTGVQRLRAICHRVHTNNLVEHVRGRRPEETARALAERTLTVAGEPGSVQSLGLDLGELLGEPIGVYHVTLQADEHRWTRDRTIVTVSDLALTVKEQRTGPWVWVTSLRTGMPVAGAEVLAFSFNDQILARALTDESGVATLDVPTGHPDGRAWLIAAQLGDDLNFVQPDRRRWSLDDVDQSGRPIALHDDLLLYTERDIYRPGDPIHATAIVRTPTGGTPKPYPLELTLRAPDGRSVAREIVTPDAELPGLVQASFATDAEAPLGAYRLEARVPGADRNLAAASILVEAFVPVRIEASATPTQERFLTGQSPAIAISARFLIGRPAAKLPVRVIGSWWRARYRSPSAPDHAFGLESSNQTHAFQSKATLDEAGELTWTLTGSTVPSEPGLWKALAQVTVTEPGGRSVNRSLTLVHDSLGRHLGVRLPDTITIGEPFEASWLVRDGEDHALPLGATELSLVRLEREWVLKKVNGEAVWQAEMHEIEIHRETIEPVSGQTFGDQRRLTCPTWGRYEIRLTDLASGARTTNRFQTGGVWTPNDGGPERLELRLDKESYAPGSTVRVSVRAPFAGTLLLTLETDQVLSHQTRTLSEPVADLEWTVPADLRGGGFVSATLVRPVDPGQTDWRPHRARGLVRLATDHTAQRLTIEIEAPPLARPQTTVPVTVTLAEHDPEGVTWVHLWAVDTGILLTTDFEVPDPHDHYFAPRRASVTTADVFGDLLPDHQRASSIDRIGGDRGDSARKLRRNSVPAHRSEAAVVWRTARRWDPEHSTWHVDLPPLEGELRWMAVATSGDRYGSTIATTTVRSPLSVSASWPRAVAPGDVFEVPITLANQTDADLEVSWEIRIEGLLEIGVAPTTRRVPAGAIERFVVPVTATEIGAVTATVVASTETAEGMITSRSRQELTVRPPVPIQSHSQVVAVGASRSESIRLEAPLRPEGRLVRVAVGPVPTVALQPAVEELIRYPFGCLEQTTSRLFALLLHGRWVGSTTGDDRTLPVEVVERIDAGLRRLARLQLPSGGLATWPHRRDADAWGSAYAATFVLAAQNEGLPVPPSLQKELIGWLDERLQTGAAETPELAAFLCRILTEADRPPRGWMARLSEQKETLDIASRAHLYAAWQFVGESERARALLLDGTLALTVPAARSGRLTSQVRQEGLLLGALAEWEPDHPWLPVLAQRLESARGSSVWGTTLDNATAVQALARWAQTPREEAHYTGRLVTDSDAAFTFDSDRSVALDLPSSTQAMTVELTGTGEAWLVTTVEGLARDDAVQELDRQLEIRRHWQDASGRKVDPMTLRTGDLVQVELRLRAPGLDAGETLDNIAIVDLLPGGLEIENPALATSDRTGSGLGSARHAELQDDRVLIFTSATRHPRVFRYGLRVVAAGEFVVPPVQASCMYDPAFSSVSGAGRCRVRGDR